MDLVFKKDYVCYLENIERHFAKGDVMKNAKPEAVKLLFDEANVVDIVRTHTPLPVAPKIEVEKKPETQKIEVVPVIEPVVPVKKAGRPAKKK